MRGIRNTSEHCMQARACFLQKTSGTIKLNRNLSVMEKLVPHRYTLDFTQGGILGGNPK